MTGLGRVGTWLAAHQIPIEPDIVAIGKGLGAGYAPLGGVLCRAHVYEALDAGSREFDLGHTWDGAPLPRPSDSRSWTSSSSGGSCNASATAGRA